MMKDMEKKIPVCVSLGPGDPDLITLKALKALQGADIILCPATTVKGKILSRSSDILKALNIEGTKVRLFNVPMSKDRTEADDVYRNLATDIHRLYNEGYGIAFVAEGDCGFYSSAHYISDYLKDMGVSTNHIPGVPAFIACGALASLHVVKQDEHLNVFPSNVTVERIRSAIEQGGTVVIMKLSQHAEQIRQAMEELEGITFHYFENVGLENKEFYSSDNTEILSRAFPYFSIMIIRR